MSSQETRRLTKLVQACLLGEEDAWNQVVDLITPVVYAICRSMGLTREESLDIFGQVCYLLLKNLKNLKTPDRLVAYVATTTRREILGVARRSRLYDDIKESGLVDQKNKTDECPEASFIQAQNMEILIKALGRLPETESRLIWHLFLDENEPTYEEISKELNRPVSSIGPTRARALERLQNILKKTGYKFGVF